MRATLSTGVGDVKAGSGRIDTKLQEPYTHKETLGSQPKDQLLKRDVLIVIETLQHIDGRMLAGFA